MKVNYTTYNVCRKQDIINPSTHHNVMVLSHETEPGQHPYWYACILKVFHTHIRHCGLESWNLLVQPMEVLWVCWYGINPGHRYGPTLTQLPKVGFVPESDSAAFGFLDPSLMIIACHLIPVFSNGCTSSLLQAGPSFGRAQGEVND